MDELNQQQLEAVQYDSGHLLIVAGPGTGKTHTVTQKIAALLQSGKALPRQIVAMTFTRKAGEQLTNRLRKLLSGSHELPFAGTFHSFCLGLLREHLQPSPLILSRNEQEELLKSVGQNQELYRQKLLELNALDFDGILRKTLELLQSDQALKEKLHQQIRYLFVDEYQDVNEDQYQLVRRLVGPHTKLCAIGDPDQAIYSFRGANMEHFLRFEKDFPGTQVLHLEQNYRSTPDIVNCANSLIEHNERRIHKNLRSACLPRPQITVAPAATPLSEAIWVAKQISKLIGGTDMNSMDQRTGEEFEKHYHFTDIAVIYRTNHQGKLLETALKKEGLPFQRLAAASWFSEKEIETIALHLAHAIDPQDLAPEFQGFQSTYEGLRRDFEQRRPSQSIKKLLEIFHLEQQWKNQTPQGEKKWENVLHLLNFSVQFDDEQGLEPLKKILDELKLLQEHDSYDERLEAVTLMSIHAAKGLEFPVVFIAGLEEGVLPYIPKNPQDPGNQHMEEERRLLYVGLTRAKERIYLTRAKTKQEKEQLPSSFLKEIAAHLVEIVPEKRNNKTLWKKKQLTIF